MRPEVRIAAVVTAAVVSVFTVSPASPAQEPAGQNRPEVLVVGTYHMGGSGPHVFDTERDDVLSPARQAEIAEVVDVLARFRPTKVLVEAGFNDREVPERYADYLAGDHELSRNEIEQLGFRLARTLGHETVYPVDADGEFPYPRLVKFAHATGRMAEFEALQADGAANAEAFSAYLASHTVLETLLHMNSEERVAEDVGAYFQLAAFSEPWDWAGPDLVSDWFRRNMRIYGNAVRLIDGADERVVIIYGAGHTGWLQFAFGNNPGLRLRKVAEFVE